MLEKEYQYYETHIEALTMQYHGKVIVIKNDAVIGAYSSNGEALQEALKHHAIGTFLIQHITDTAKVEVQRFYSRVYV